MRILHLDENHPLLIERLANAGFHNITAYKDPIAEIESMLALIDGLVLRSRIPIDRSLLSQCKALKFVARVGAGLENIDQDQLNTLGIKLFSAPMGNANAVGEHALGMLLNLTNKLRAAHQSIANGDWKREHHRGDELEGKTVGIIGYGNMGQSFAQKLKGFAIKEVIFYDIVRKKPDGWARQVSLEEVQENADIISLHTPETPLTIGMIDLPFIEKMKKPFWLINTARGSAIKTSAVVNAMRTQKIKGVALDVFEYEERSFEQLLQGKTPRDLQHLLLADNAILSPHVAGWSVESHQKLATIIADQIIENFGSNLLP